MESTEFEALIEIERRGGKAPFGVISRAMKISSDYGRIVLVNLGKKDYIDITREGICEITKKGKEMLKSRGISSRGISAQITKEEKGKPKIITLSY